MLARAQERLELLSQLLQKEQKLLQTIDRLRLQASDENREKHIRWMLQLMASPKRWQMSDGEVAQVHTPFTTRAKELMELYNGLMLPLLTVDERLDVLLHVKWTVKEFDCNLSRDIVEVTVIAPLTPTPTLTLTLTLTFTLPLNLSFPLILPI